MSIRRHILHFVLACTALWGLAFSNPGQAAETVRIGVLAIRPKPITLARWQPLATYLSQAAPGRSFTIEALTYPELEAAIAMRKVDFVFTNPSHYALVAHRNGLSSPLATLINLEEGVSTPAIGGVILARSERSDIRTLTDLRGKTIVATSTEALSGFQAQAYELARAGLRLPQDVKVLQTGLPHDLAITALLEGRADVAFVRAGVIETMSRENRLDLRRLQIINRQDTPSFPVALSTRLYPEWPIAAMPHTDEALGRKVAAALLSLPSDSAYARAMGIHGFTIPADYEGVRSLLQELRLPPYDNPPSFTADDVWKRYRWQVYGTLLAGVLIVLLAGTLLINRHVLLRQKKAITKQTLALAASEQRFRVLHELSPVGMALNRLEDGALLAANRSLCRLLGYTEEELRRLEYRQVMPGCDAAERAALAATGRYGPCEKEFVCKDGARVVVQLVGVLLRDRQDGDLVYSVIQDITEQKHQERVHWELGLFTGGPVAVFIWQPADGWPVEYVSPNVVEVLGYSAEEVCSASFRFAELIHPDDIAPTAGEVAEHLAAGHSQFEQSYRLRHKCGEYRWFYDFTVPERNDQGEVVRIRGYMFDLSRMKQAEEALANERQRLAGIIEGTNVGTWEWNVQTGELVINERWAKIVGYTLEELAPIGIHTWLTLASPEDLAESQ
ncbi:MAG: PhnD/SsuA/transferrin family substrate-binding protein, partial [Zoogloea sp.]|nr:PhnD/SsuA/transferrin family substrate-binding protein [Zoogloea sp.]